jgi:hypothetical protein
VVSKISLMSKWDDVRVIAYTRVQDRQRYLGG